jgi:elongator complex protein 3
MVKKLSRTISGVTPVAVMTRPSGCPGRCIYCPTYSATPQSYTPESPAVLRARSCDYDPGAQVRLRLRILADMGHPTDKVELIIMGGTFLATSPEYQYGFIKACFEAMNGQPAATLVEAQQVNETAARRCTGLCIETRPDCCGPEAIRRMLEFGATRVELGVQMLDDDIYQTVRRGHTVADVVTATQRLKEGGFKVYYHWMPGLPGATPEKDRALTAWLFNDNRFCPDGLKIYPTMVVAGTELEQWYRDGRYQPYPDETMIDLVCDMKTIVPPYVRISRVLRDIPSQYIVAGLRDSLRDRIRKRLEATGRQCRCIRCREYGHRHKAGWLIGEPRLTRMDYNASGGWEIFLAYEDIQGTLFGLLRLRIQETVPDRETGPVALIRELHVFGSEVALGERQPQAAQHRGLGAGLLREAERIISEEFGLNRVMVLSGVGARSYYREFGYELNGPYMVKAL